MTPRERAEMIALGYWSSYDADKDNILKDDIEEAITSAVAAEREACAQVAEKKATDHDFYDGGYEVGKKIAAEIRTRGDLKG